MPPAKTRRPSAPPARAGVGASRVVLPAGAWASVLHFLVQRFPRVDAAEWRDRLRRGDVLDAQGRPVGAGDRCASGDTLFYFRAVPDEPPLPVAETLVYRDEWIAVVDKPHGMAAVPAGRHLAQTLLLRLRRRLGNDLATPVHRIDRDTAGLVLFSLQPQSRAAYHAMFRERRVDKVYEAIAPYRDDLAWPQWRRSRLEPSTGSFMQMTEQPGEPNTETHVALVERRGEFARYELRPTTGQRHQLRVHLAALGIPIVDDRIYPTLLPDSADDTEALAREARRPLRLLARRLAFTDPMTGAARTFESGLRLEFPVSPSVDQREV